MCQQPVVEARGIGRRIPQKEAWLLRDIDLQINAGGRLGVVGPTGSGKSLLLRTIVLLDPLDAGEIRWRASPVADPDVPRFRSTVAYLHQRPALHDGTVGDIFRRPYSLRVNRGKQYDEDRLLTYLDWLGRDGSFLTRRKHHLSGGEGQIVALLRAIQLAPQVLLLDEPTAALDSQAAEAVELLVNRWMGEAPDQRATLWVTHNLEQARRVADQVFRMSAGRLHKG